MYFYLKLGVFSKTKLPFYDVQINIQMGISPFIRQWEQIQKSTYFDHMYSDRY